MGLSGVAESDVNRVFKLIDDTLQQVARDGFPQERIDSLLHRVELSQKHVSSNFGLTLASAATPAWVHGRDPVERLQVNRWVELLKEKLKDRTFLQRKLRQYLIDNKHRVELVMTGDMKHAEQQAAAEKEQLDAVEKNALDEAARRRILDQQHALSQRQSSQADVSVLPTLRVSEDVPLQGLSTPLGVHTLSPHVSLHVAEQPTNGIAYVRALMSLSNLPADLQPYVPLFCDALTHMPTRLRSDKDIAQLLEAHTGGLGASPLHVADPLRAGAAYEHIHMSTHCLYRNATKLSELLAEVCDPLRTFADTARLRTLISLMASNMQDSLTSSGHHYAKGFAAAALSPLQVYCPVLLSVDMRN